MSEHSAEIDARVVERVEAVVLKWWPDADDPRARDLIRAMGKHSDSYCVSHCSNGVRHSQCGCQCDHRAARVTSPGGSDA